ncbi:MAG: phenylalanine--tRNA ligase subunit alpha [Candidatus Thermoplasmatota archaeon]
MDIDKIVKELSNNEKKVLISLKELDGQGEVDEVGKIGGFTRSIEVMNAAIWLKSKRLIEIHERRQVLYALDSEGLQYVDEGLPEKRLLRFLDTNNGKASLEEISKKIDRKEVPIAVGWLKTNKWGIIKKEGKETIIEITEIGRKALQTKTHDEVILEKLKETPYVELDRKDVQNLLSRKNVIKQKEQITSILVLTDLGRKILERNVSFTDDISQITPDVIRDGEWKNKTIRPYDIHAFSPDIHPGKTHPLIYLINKIRRVFLEMGFEEIEGDFVESCFWDMDVLFIPQDHPAREMQDTFYCKKPRIIPISDKNLVERIAMIHENGGGTNSTGWGYRFSRSECEKALLRTHTTVNTIRYLYEHPEPPCKVFSIGRVFRKESIDSTHLPEFYQIEGIIHEDNANFTQLLGVIKEFYHRIGFEKIRFRPGYFPYTEPSMEVDVLWGDRWIELGGSGLFRPEVTHPIGIKNPVLAWGLGLERLAMQMYRLDDIRSLYISDLGWLRRTKLLEHL